jgi:hypothetical protein
MVKGSLIKLTTHGISFFFFLDKMYKVNKEANPGREKNKTTVK